MANDPVHAEGTDFELVKITIKSYILDSPIQTIHHSYRKRSVHPKVQLIGSIIGYLAHSKNAASEQQTMIRKDYIMRLVDQFSQALARIIGLKEEKAWHQALEMVEDALVGKLDLPTGWPKNQSMEAMEAEVKDWKDPDQLKVVSELLYERFDLMLLSGQRQQVLPLAERLVHLLYLQIGQQPFALDSHTRLENVLFFLRQQKLANSTYQRIVNHYRNQGKYSIAEDWLFEALELSDSPANLIAFGKTFYEQLLALRDEQLERGCLPRAEVVQSLDELNSR